MKLSISTTRRQTLLGWAYWLISLFVLPSAFETINNQLATPLPESVLNLIFFSVNFFGGGLHLPRFSVGVAEGRS